MTLIRATEQFGDDIAKTCEVLCEVIAITTRLIKDDPLFRILLLGICLLFAGLLMAQISLS